MRFEKVILNDVATVYDSLHKSPQYTKTGIPMVRVRDLEFGFLKLQNTAFVDRDTYEEFSKKHKPTKGDIVFSRVGSYGITSYVDSDDVFCLGQNTVVIVSDKINSKFLYYKLLSPIVRQQIEMMVTGSTQKTISLKNIRNLELYIPELKSQQKIARFLYSIDKKINVNETIILNLEELAQTLFKHWFIDFEFPNEDGKPYKSSGGKMVESELGMIPEGWSKGVLKDITLNFDRKRVPLSKLEREKRDKIYPYYGAASLMDYVDNFIFDGIYVLVGEDGTVIDDKGYPILQYVWGKFWVNNHAHVLQGNNNFTTEFIYLLLKRTNVSNIVTGAVQPKINQTNLNKIPAIIPNENVLDQFNEIISSVFTKKRQIKDENNSLEKLRDTLLPKLLSGEIELPDDMEVTDDVPIS